MSHLIASVVIPTRNRPEAVQHCLDALAAQDFPAGDFEVIVVDDGSSTPLEVAPTRWAAQFPLFVIHQTNTGPAGARNRGASEARGEFLAFTDDDCLPTPTWLANLVGALRQNHEALIGGSTFNGLKDDLFAEASQLILELVYEHFNSDPAGAYFFASNNIALRRELYRESGGFDADFPSPAAEDREFCDRWRMQQRPLLWERSALLEHRHHQSMRQFSKLHFRYGKGAFMYQAKRRERSSGTMKEDMGFHRSLLRAAARKMSGRPFSTRARLWMNLLLWQAANAAGFFSTWCRIILSKKPPKL